MFFERCRPIRPFVGLPTTHSCPTRYLVWSKMFCWNQSWSRSGIADREPREGKYFRESCGPVDGCNPPRHREAELGNADRCTLCPRPRRPFARKLSIPLEAPRLPRASGKSLPTSLRNVLQHPVVGASSRPRFVSQLLLRRTSSAAWLPRSSSRWAGFVNAVASLY